ncbi:MAG: hypothetical protein QG658_25 [Patescibacteria group bacterium]|jgi:hypothetical protein|nr:hypothetical protein [Patescibacteria group bacterium]
MNSATGVVIGAILFIAGIYGARYSWRKYNNMNDLILLDMSRISVEKPNADLDSDQDFVAHKETATGWLVVVCITSFLAICGLVITIASLT